MTKWDYFWTGAKISLLAMMLFTLLFGEVTVWPMKEPLWKHTVAYPIVVLIFALALISSIKQLWR